MKLNDWLRHASPAQRQRVADDVGTSVAYLYQLGGEHKRTSPERAHLIEKATRRHTPKAVVTARELRPDIARMFR